MGRAEKEITTDNAALHELAQWLRDLRAHAGLTYRKLAERAGLHATTLQRVASGDSVPQIVAVLAYARGCDGSPEQARRLWRKARREQVRAAAPHSRPPAPAPALVRDFADLSAALRDLYEEAGAPSLRTMEERAGGFGALPRSSAHRIVNRQTVPHSLRQFQAFLRACEVPAEDQKAWEDAWSRAWRFEKQEDAGLNEVHEVLVQRQRQRAVRDLDRLYARHGDVAIKAEGPLYLRPLAPRGHRRLAEARAHARRGAGIDMGLLLSLLSGPVRHEHPEFRLDRVEPDHPGYTVDEGPRLADWEMGVSAAG
ncbi:helix-turn-helix domain-containing protein [Streptomyces sp. NRRL B-1347]|uniref:helix-turn-helix domain-containing protein n=1 Tax=Streptomyces sp. NRRL B-1347 TaxID=1476877 RepID=UPI00068CB14E|nr:helix-turn-helix transcriptional regulator [Streptomyces sp. NRRL B-1347]